MYIYIKDTDGRFSLSPIHSLGNFGARVGTNSIVSFRRLLKPSLTRAAVAPSKEAPAERWGETKLMVMGNHRETKEKP